MPFKCANCGQMTATSAKNWCASCKGGSSSTVVVEATPNSATLTKTEVKTKFGDHCSKTYEQGEYWGGDNNQFHVHNYSGAGAHVKCAANTSPKLLDTRLNAFYAYGWNDVVAGVKLIKAGKNPGERSAVCGAIILFLMDHGGLTNTDLRAKMGALVDACQ